MTHRKIARLTLLVLFLPLAYASFGQNLEENTDRHSDDFRPFTSLKLNTGPGLPHLAHCCLTSGIPAATRDSAILSAVVPEKTRPPRPPGKPGEWEVERNSIGGAAVRVYKLSIKSDGHFVRTNSMHREQPEEEGSVPPAALEKLNRVILAAKPSTWKASYGGSRCNDCVRTTFRLEICGTDGKWVPYSSAWELPSPLPSDLEAVLAAMQF